MIAAFALAASLLAPSGVTAGIQADPVCLPVTARPGHSYPLAVYVPGSGPVTLAVTPAHGSLERALHQVPASWVSFSGNGPGEVAVALSVPPGAAPGAYWSDIEASAQGQPGAGAQAPLGTAATTAFVFTVGPSPVPAPPCGALDTAYSSGKFPAWPTAAFATSGWPQVIAQDQADQPEPVTSPTAGTGDPPARAVPAAAYSPAAASSRNSWGLPSDWPGWAIIIVLGFVILRWLLRLLGISR